MDSFVSTTLTWRAGWCPVIPCNKHELVFDLVIHECLRFNLKREHITLQMHTIHVACGYLVKTKDATHAHAWYTRFHSKGTFPRDMIQTLIKTSNHHTSHKIEVAVRKYCISYVKPESVLDNAQTDCSPLRFTRINCDLWTTITKYRRWCALPFWSPWTTNQKALPCKHQLLNNNYLF